MIVYRIVKRTYSEDLSGEGARLFGGRWNRKGSAVIYTSESRSLATLEYLVHVPLAFVPADLCIVSIEIPDDVLSLEISEGSLPENWRKHPAPDRLAEIGTHWLLKGESLTLKVPSAVVHQEYNILVNPSHHDMNRVMIQLVAPFFIDRRLVK